MTYQEYRDQLNLMTIFKGDNNCQDHTGWFQQAFGVVIGGKKYDQRNLFFQILPKGLIILFKSMPVINYLIVYIYG